MSLFSFTWQNEKLKKLPTCRDIRENSFADYLIDEKGNFKKDSKTTWAKSQWQHLSNMCAREGVTVKFNPIAENSFSFSIKTPTGNVEHSHHRTFYEMYKAVKLDEIANEFASLKSQGRIIREAKSVDHKLSLAFINNSKLKDNIKQSI